MKRRAFLLLAWRYSFAPPMASSRGASTTRVYLTVNLKSARQLGQTIPTVLLQRADFVIQ